jgi:hypothetical protein
MWQFQAVADHVADRHDAEPVHHDAANTAHPDGTDAAHAGGHAAVRHV